MEPFWKPLIRSLLLFPVLFVPVTQAFDFPKKMQDGVPVKIEDGLFGSSFYQGANDIPLLWTSVCEVVARNEEARPDVTAARIWYYTGLPMAAVGGYMVGYYGTKSLLGGGFNAPAFFLGVGWSGLSLLFSSVSDGKLVQAVEKYNAGLPADARIHWEILPRENRLSLRLSF